MGGGSVLVVDADAVSRAELVSLLAEDGIEARTARDAEEAHESALADRPQLVLLEVKLPRMCGYELLRRLRGGFGHSLPIVLMSGDRTEPFDRVAGLLLGADDYLVKPFAPDEVLARVRRLLRSSASRGVTAGALTAREREVLELLAQGKRQQERKGGDLHA